MNVHEQITSFFDGKEDIVAVYLFGSYAAGKELRSSDVDLALLFDSRDRQAVTRKLDEYLVALPRLVRKDVHLTALDFAGEELLRQVFKRGKCLLVNDPRKLAVFKMIAFSKIVNFHYYRKQMQAGLVRRVMGAAQSG